MTEPRLFLEVAKLTNLTTDISMLRKIQMEFGIEAVEYDTDHIAFEVDEKSCRKGQLISVEGFLHMEGAKLDFSATGKIANVTDIGQSRSKAVIELHSYNKVLWKKFVLLMKQKQAKVDKLFFSIKDED